LITDKPAAIGISKAREHTQKQKISYLCGRDVNQGHMAKIEVTGDLERALRKFGKQVTEENILSEYKRRGHFVAKKSRKKRTKRAK
jgi:ribosomal protein S21